MTTRRTFLGTVAGGAAAATAFRDVARAAGSVKPPLGLQLYSLREALAKDVSGTLEQVKACCPSAETPVGRVPRDPQSQRRRGCGFLVARRGRSSSE